MQSTQYSDISIVLSILSSMVEALRWWGWWNLNACRVRWIDITEGFLFTEWKRFTTGGVEEISQLSFCCLPAHRFCGSLLFKLSGNCGYKYWRYFSFQTFKVWDGAEHQKRINRYPFRVWLDEPQHHNTSPASRENYKDCKIEPKLTIQTTSKLELSIIFPIGLIQLKQKWVSAYVLRLRNQAEPNKWAKEPHLYSGQEAVRCDTSCAKPIIWK